MRSEVKLIGNIGKIETREGKNGKYTVLSVAVDKGYRDKESGEWVEKTEWYTAIKWGGLPDGLVKKAKGAKVIVRGELVSTASQEEGEGSKLSIKVLEVDVLSFSNKNKEE